MIFTQLRDPWEQQKGLTSSLQEWYKKYQTMCQHVHEACGLLSAEILKIISLQEAQENAQKGLHRLDMEFNGVRVQSGHNMVRMQIPGNLEIKLDQIKSQMASLRLNH